MDLRDREHWGRTQIHQTGCPDDPARRKPCILRLSGLNPRVLDFDNERDERLLLDGLEAEPENVRYMFYLAQTYMCLQRTEEAIRWYERRIAAGGWVEEAWYAHYQCARMHLDQGRAAEAELHVQKAHALLPLRAEALVLLAGHLRGQGHHHKAWHYLKLAEGCRPYHDALFMETESYGHRQLLERSALAYYISEPEALERGMDACLAYQGPDECQALLNVGHYARRLPGCRWKRLHFPMPATFRSSSVACNAWGLLNVRAVNYNIRDDGSYELGADGYINTRNFSCSWTPTTAAWAHWREVVVPGEDQGAPPRRQDCILGLEDVRLCGNVFTATTREYSYCEANRMVLGTYPDLRCHPVRQVVSFSTIYNAAYNSSANKVDGVVVSPGTRVLLVGQSVQEENGIYVGSTGGTELTRAPDLDTGSSAYGAQVFVVGPTGSNNYKGFICEAPVGASTVGTHGLSWRAFTT